MTEEGSDERQSVSPAAYPPARRRPAPAREGQPDCPSELPFATGTTVTGSYVNRTLAQIARADADRAMRHRRAWLCLAVLLDGARTVGGARAHCRRFLRRTGTWPQSC
jgi:hypothetical protein